jgi:hypothetical protein
MASLVLALLSSLLLAQAKAPDLEVVVAASERVWLCPLHPETHHAGAGRCEVCRRPLEERAVSWQWACPMHPQLVSAEAGPCPVCEMPRVVTTVEVVWRCPEDPADVRSAPGACREGLSRLRPELRALAHGDHNPRHGGLFFMAADRFHHIEGTLQDGRFRIFLYDNYTEPLPPTAAAARVGDAPMGISPDGRALELPLETGLPAEIVVRVDFGEGEHRFDFVFNEESLPPTLPELVIPDSAEATIAEIARRDERLRELMRLGAWTELYLPALQAKELVLALARQAPETDPVAVKRVVRATWLLDLYGDNADREQVERAYALFREGWSGLKEAR